MVEIGLVEVRKCHEAVKIVYCDFTTLERDRAILTEFPKDPVDVNRTQPQRISQPIWHCQDKILERRKSII